MVPYYEADGITIYHGDCRDMTTYHRVDMVLTDIPYDEVNRASSGLRNLDKGGADMATVPIEEMVPLILRWLASSVYVFCGIEQVSKLRQDMVQWGLSTRLCIWEKTNPSPMNGDRLWLSSLECCVFGRRERAYFGGFCASPVFRGPTRTESQHPTEKPRWLFESIIQMSSTTGGVVLDPFMGSGTTLVAAKNLGRKAIGIEIEEKYCEIAARRLDQQVLAL